MVPWLKYLRFLIVAILSMAICFSIPAADCQASTGTVTASVLSIRQEPSVDSVRIGSLLEGAAITITEQKGEWIKIRLSSGMVGWVNSNYVRLSNSGTGSDIKQPVVAPTTVSTEVIAPPIVVIDGQKVAFDVPPIIENGRTLVPLRAIFEKMGAKVSWNADTRTASAVKGDTTVVVAIGSKSPTINGAEKTIDVPAEIIDGRTLAPMRFVCEAFGGAVSWAADTRTVSVKSKSDSKPDSEDEDVNDRVVQDITYSTVTGSVVNLRSGPGTQYAKIGSVSRGTGVSVLDDNDGWSHIRLADGSMAWVLGTFLKNGQAPAADPPSNVITTPEPILSASGNKVEVTGSTVNLREGPGTNYLTKGQVNKGDQLELISEQGGWYKVQTSRGAAFIAGWLSRLLVPETAQAEEVPSVNVSGDLVDVITDIPNITTYVPPETADISEDVDVVYEQPSIPRIVIDAGHGGVDPGTLGISGNSREKIFNLDIATKAATLLGSRGYEVALTRYDDSYVSLQNRVAIANSSPATLFVSIHCNANDSSAKRGTTVYYYVDKAIPAMVAQAAERSRLASVMQQTLVDRLGLGNEGVRQNNYYVIRYTNMPSILIETAYLSNPTEEALLNDPAFRDLAAEAITEGIIRYLGD